MEHRCHCLAEFVFHPWAFIIKHVCTLTVSVVLQCLLQMISLGLQLAIQKRMLSTNPLGLITGATKLTFKRPAGGETKVHYQKLYSIVP